MKFTEDKERASGKAAADRKEETCAARGRTVFHVRLAEIPVEVSAIYPETEAFFKDYLTAGSVPSFRVRASAEDLRFEQEQSDLLCGLENRRSVRHSGRYLETLAVCRAVSEKMIDYGILLIHGSAVAVGGEVYLFTAPSGTGKSTHAGLWRKLFGERAVMINDDKPFLKCTEEGVTVYGNPWNGKHRLGTNTSAPLKAVCVLTRDTRNHIEPVTAREALPALFAQCYRPRDPERAEKALTLIGRICDHAGLYRLGCNTEPEAARIAYEGMQNREEKRL